MGDAYQHAVSTLDNGLTVVTVAMPHLHSAMVSVFSRVGSRHESAGSNGLSHFLEHMFFRGCDGYEDSTALNGAMEDLGGFLDGYTTRDYSGYQSTVHPKLIGDATEILGRMFQAPRFSDIDIERSIILEEILDALDDRGRQIDLDTIAHQEAFGVHPLAQSIDGPRRNLKRFTVEDLEAHRRRFYGAKNLVVCFAGRVEPARCRRIAQRCFSELFNGRPASEGRPPKLPERPGRLRYVRTDDSQTRCRLSFRAVSDVHPDYPALILLRRVLDGGLSARLQVELVERRGIVYEISADLGAYSDCGLFDFELAVAHKKLAYALEELSRVILDLKEHGVTQEELDRVRRRARVSVEFGLDSPNDMSHWFGVGRLFHRPVRPEDRMAHLEKVSVDDVRRVARKYLASPRLTAAAVGGADPASVRAARRTVARLADAL